MPWRLVTVGTCPTTVDDDEADGVGRAWIEDGEEDKRSAKIATIVSLSMSGCNQLREGGKEGTG